MWHALLADGRAHRSNERGVRLGRQHLIRSSSTSSLQPLALSLPKSESSTRTSANSVEWRLGCRVPQTGNVLLQRVGQSAMRLLGWQFAGSFPNHAQFVAVVAPHTSNWDFPILLAAKWALQLDARWMGKNAIFRPPLGWILRALGGIPIWRGTSHNVVDASILAFAKRPQLVLVLAPEGTRKYVAQAMPRQKSRAFAPAMRVCWGVIPNYMIELRDPGKSGIHQSRTGTLEHPRLIRETNASYR